MLKVILVRVQKGMREAVEKASMRLKNIYIYIVMNRMFLEIRTLEVPLIRSHIK